MATVHVSAAKWNHCTRRIPHTCICKRDARATHSKCQIRSPPSLSGPGKVLSLAERSRSSYHAFQFPNPARSRGPLLALTLELLPLIGQRLGSPAIRFGTSYTRRQNWASFDFERAPFGELHYLYRSDFARWFWDAAVRHSNAKNADVRQPTTAHCCSRVVNEIFSFVVGTPGNALSSGTPFTVINSAVPTPASRSPISGLSLLGPRPRGVVSDSAWIGPAPPP